MFGQLVAFWQRMERSVAVVAAALSVGRQLQVLTPRSVAQIDQHDLDLIGINRAQLMAAVQPANEDGLRKVA